MITDIDRKTIQEISEKCHAKRVFLFGLSLAPEKESRDIDIAVEGISPKRILSILRRSLICFIKVRRRHRAFRSIKISAAD